MKKTTQRSNGLNNQKNKDITLLYNYARPNMATFTLFPLVVFKDIRDFRLTKNMNWVLNRDKNDSLLIVGWFKDNKSPTPEEIILLEKLRKKYKVLAYFDDNDSTEVQQSGYLPWFDLWFKKQLFKDRNLYLKSFRGNRIFSEYYVENFGVQDPVPAPDLSPLRPEDIPKLRLSWSILLGRYPLRPLIDKGISWIVRIFGIRAARFFVHPGKKTSIPRPGETVCHARFGSGGFRPTVGYQRKLFLETVKGHSYFLAGRVSKKQYDLELKRVKGILSPFGWGEVCYRDSEALRNGAVLFKPDMAHLETWPDLYRPEVTYVPLKWDASDVVQKVESVLKDEKKLEELRMQGWNGLMEAEAQFPDRVRWLADEIRSKRG